MDKPIDKKPSLIVLAAGLGSRYGSLKQIDQFGPSGETIIDYSIYDAIRAGFEKVVFIIRKSIEEEFKEVFVGKFGNVLDVRYVFQEIDIVPEGVVVPRGRTKPWGTGHAVLMAADQVREPFAVINADDFYGPRSIQLLFDQLNHMDHSQLHACLIAYRLKNTLSDHGYVSRGICEISENNDLRKVSERTQIYKEVGKGIYFVEGNERFALSGNELVSMNLLGFTPPFFDRLKAGFGKFVQDNINELKAEYFLPTAVTDMIENDHVAIPVIETSEQTYGVTYREDKPIVSEMIRQQVDRGVYPAKLWE